MQVISNASQRTRLPPKHLILVRWESNIRPRSHFLLFPSPLPAHTRLPPSTPAQLPLHALLANAAHSELQGIQHTIFGVLQWNEPRLCPTGVDAANHEAHGGFLIYWHIACSWQVVEHVNWIRYILRMHMRCSRRALETGGASAGTDGVRAFLACCHRVPDVPTTDRFPGQQRVEVRLASGAARRQGLLDPGGGIL